MKCDGYLYSIRDGKLKVEKGEALSGRVGFNRFEKENRSRIIIRRKPWIVYNNFIWCPVDGRDDVRAVKLFVEHEEKECDKRRIELKKHEYRLIQAVNLLIEFQQKEEREEK